jgi:hypothetical protein
MLEKSPLHWEKFNEQMPEFTVAIDSKDDVDRILPHLAENGAIMIKTFNKQDPEVYEHLVNKAKVLSLKIVHDPGQPLYHPMPMDKALPLGITSFEHAMAPWPAVLRDDLREELNALIEKNAKEMELMPFMMKTFGMGQDSICMQKLENLCKTMWEKNAYLCPTLQVFVAMQKEQEEETPPDDPEEAMARAGRKQMGAVLEKISNFLVAEFTKRKVKLLVGHDGASPEGIFSEMSLLQECGVSAAEILRGATIYPAQWMGVAHRMGAILPGKEANLLVVDEDPLQDINNVRSAFLVIQKGKTVYRKESG